MRRFVCLVAALTIVGLVPTWVIGDLIVVPNALTATEGDANNGFPFNITKFGRTSQRYQQVSRSLTP